MTVVIESDLCVGCEICVDECKAGAIVMANGIARHDTSVCTECKICIDICPSDAIEWTN